jgi:hypothetical protein
MTIHSPTAHIQAGNLDNSSTTLKAADSQKNHKYDALSTNMGYKLVLLTATPYGAESKRFEDFSALLANASEQIGGQNYELALSPIQNNFIMTIRQKADVESSYRLKQIHHLSSSRAASPR